MANFLPHLKQSTATAIPFATSSDSRFTTISTRPILHRTGCSTGHRRTTIRTGKMKTTTTKTIQVSNPSRTVETQNNNRPSRKFQEGRFNATFSIPGRARLTIHALSFPSNIVGVPHAILKSTVPLDGLCARASSSRSYM